MHLGVKAFTEEFSRYKKLVDSDWNKKTFGAVSALLWDVVSVSALARKEEPPWLTFLKDVKEKKLPRVMPDEVVAPARVLSLSFRHPHIPKFPNRIVSGASKLSAETETAIVYLLLQVVTQLTGETGFFRDLQSLLYLNSVHYLLPQLRLEKSETEYAALANVMQCYARSAWWDEPAHMFFLLASMMGQLGFQQTRLRFLRDALAATPIDDHSYLTKANSYWDELLELGEKDRAMEFLINLSRNAPASYAEEIGEMIVETASFQKAS